MNPYPYRNKVILNPKQNQLYREFSLGYITNWFSGRYDRYKKYLFKCFYKYPYEFERIKSCLKEEYNVPSSIAEDMVNIARYGYETAGGTDKRLFINELSGEWNTSLGILKLYVSEDLISTNDTIFPYANKITGNYDWNGGGSIEGSMNWRGLSSGIFIGADTNGEFKIKFQEGTSGKRTFKGTLTENNETYDWKGFQVKEY